MTSARYWAHARVLAASFLERHPGSQFSVLDVDGSCAELGGIDGVEVLTPADVGIDTAELARRATMYGFQGFAVSMKPNLLAALLARHGGPVVFLDSDGYLYEDITHLGGLAEAHGVVLSAHLVDPNPTWWGQDGPEQQMLRAGVFNAGLVAVAPGAEAFLDWWGERTARRCVFDLPRGVMLEQTWLALVPGIFEHHVLGDRGCNVAGWNLNTRDVSFDGDTPTIDGVPLRHYHFACSYDPERPDLLTTQDHAHWWPKLSERPGVARLSREYAPKLLAAGYRECLQRPVRYETMPDGDPIENWMRSTYRAGVLVAERDGLPEPPNPFTDSEKSFLRWVQRQAATVAEALESVPEGAHRAPVLDADAPSLETGELMWAISHSRDLMERIAELEDARDDAIAWGQRASADVQELLGLLADRDARIAELRTLMASVWSSPSWRITRPLRAAKLLKRGRTKGPTDGSQAGA